MLENITSFIQVLSQKAANLIFNLNSHYFKHKSAEISKYASIGDNTKIWNDCQIRERAVIGKNCILGKGVYVDADVLIGDDCKIQNYACLYTGTILEENVFIGPAATFTNDMYPRASMSDWEISPTLVKKGASVGANTTIRCGVVIGEFSMIGAGSVVTGDIPKFALAIGNPARVVGFVDEEGKPINQKY